MGSTGPVADGRCPVRRVPHREPDRSKLRQPVPSPPRCRTTSVARPRGGAAGGVDLHAPRRAVVESGFDRPSGGAQVALGAAGGPVTVESAAVIRRLRTGVRIDSWASDLVWRTAAITVSTPPRRLFRQLRRKSAIWPGAQSGGAARAAASAGPLPPARSPHRRIACTQRTTAQRPRPQRRSPLDSRCDSFKRSVAPNSGCRGPRLRLHRTYAPTVHTAR